MIIRLCLLCSHLKLYNKHFLIQLLGLGSWVLVEARLDPEGYRESFYWDICSSQKGRYSFDQGQVRWQLPEQRKRGIYYQMNASQKSLSGSFMQISSSALQSVQS
jgi:hypothetical protein